ncbi:MAG: hypothetical protein ACOX5R_17370 [bacterium]|jgi:predicted transposase YdaD
MKDGAKRRLEAEKGLYNSQFERRDKADILTALTIFAGLRDKQLATQLLERRRDIMIESVAYELIKGEGIEEGIKKGREEGTVLKSREDVLAILEVRFHSVPADIRQTVEEMTDISQLNQLHREAVLVQSLDEFSQKMKPLIH